MSAWTSSWTSTSQTKVVPDDLIARRIAIPTDQLPYRLCSNHSQLMPGTAMLALAQGSSSAALGPATS